MRATLLRRAAALVAAFAGAVTLAVAAPSAATGDPVTAQTWLTRYSGNGCGSAEFDYTYRRDGSYYAIDIGTVHFGWHNVSGASCGVWGEPYIPVLQWKGERWGAGFEWENFRFGHYLTGPSYSGTGYANVRFRVCNMNTNTSYVGTCGSS